MQVVFESIQQLFFFDLYSNGPNQNIQKSPYLIGKSESQSQTLGAAPSEEPQ
jgi:hypothetical protein